MIENEVSILRRVHHVNIILLVEEFDGPNELYLVMELVKVRLSAIVEFYLKRNLVRNASHFNKCVAFDLSAC